MEAPSGDEGARTGGAYNALSKIQKTYRAEKQLVEKHADDTLVEARRKYAAPLLDGFKKYLEDKSL